MSKQEVIDKDILRGRNLPIIDEVTGEIIELPRFKTLGNLHLFPKVPGVVNEEASLTVPNQSMTIPEMMERFNNGLSVPVSTMEYGDDEDDDDPLPIVQDLMDIEEAREFARRIISDYDKALKEEAKKPKKSESQKEPGIDQEPSAWSDQEP